MREHVASRAIFGHRHRHRLRTLIHPNGTICRMLCHLLMEKKNMFRNGNSFLCFFFFHFNSGLPQRLLVRCLYAAFYLSAFSCSLSLSLSLASPRNASKSHRKYEKTCIHFAMEVISEIRLYAMRKRQRGREMKNEMK